MGMKYFNERAKMKVNLIVFPDNPISFKKYIYSKSSNDFMVLINGVK